MGWEIRNRDSKPLTLRLTGQTLPPCPRAGVPGPWVALPADANGESLTLSPLAVSGIIELRRVPDPALLELTPSPPDPPASDVAYVEISWPPVADPTPDPTVASGSTHDPAMAPTRAARRRAKRGQEK